VGRAGGHTGSLGEGAVRATAAAAAAVVVVVVVVVVVMEVEAAAVVEASAAEEAAATAGSVRVPVLIRPSASIDVPPTETSLPPAPPPLPPNPLNPLNPMSPLCPCGGTAGATRAACEGDGGASVHTSSRSNVPYSLAVSAVGVMAAVGFFVSMGGESVSLPPLRAL